MEDPDKKKKEEKVSFSFLIYFLLYWLEAWSSLG
uniref:Uncharacterized protein n=1 Tax=Cucumis melo TaxID=3656 RepID=A0A9I9E693_CUCME